MANLGFTGTRQGMNATQSKYLPEIIFNLTSDNGIEKAYHGDCRGADTQFHRMMLDKKIPIYICPTFGKDRAFNRHATFVHRAQQALVRNKYIVKQSDYLIATPKEQYEIQRSGTWATVRYGRAAGIPVFVILPDGKIEVYNV